MIGKGERFGGRGGGPWSVKNIEYSGNVSFKTVLKVAYYFF